MSAVRAVAALSSALCFAATLAAEATMPVNPDRPIGVENCRDARAALREAELGNPLISVEQNRARVETFRQLATRYCANHDPR